MKKECINRYLRDGMQEPEAWTYSEEHIVQYRTQQFRLIEELHKLVQTED